MSGSNPAFLGQNTTIFATVSIKDAEWVDVGEDVETAVVITDCQFFHIRPHYKQAPPKIVPSNP